MTRFLFAPFAVSGHVNPGLPIARELVARGHDVRWYGTHRFKRAIEETGARFVPYRRARQIDETRLSEMFPERPAAGLRQLQWDLANIFAGIAGAQFADLSAELTREPADVIVSDQASNAAGFVSEHFGLPWGVYGVSVPGFTSRDAAPIGLAVMPSSSPLGRLRNRALHWLTDRVIFRDARLRFRALRRDLGLPKYDGNLFDYARRAEVYLQGTVASFEYPRTDMPRQLRFIGATIPEPPAKWTPPLWWGELEGRRIVLVTQGTINNEYDQLICPAIRALAREDVLVIVTTGSRPPEDVGIDPLPANVRVARHVPYAYLMPKVSLLVTNGGYGSVQIALAHGVPILAIGDTEEKPEILNRVTWSGAGIGIRALVAGEAQIREAARRVLGDPRYSLRAGEIATEMAGLDAPHEAALYLERLDRSRGLAPVVPLRKCS